MMKYARSLFSKKIIVNGSSLNQGKSFRQYLFDRKKGLGKYRVIFNIKALNKYVAYR